MLRDATSKLVPFKKRVNVRTTLTRPTSSNDDNGFSYDIMYMKFEHFNLDRQIWQLKSVKISSNILMTQEFDNVLTSRFYLTFKYFLISNTIEPCRGFMKTRGHIFATKTDTNISWVTIAKQTECWTPFFDSEIFKRACYVYITGFCSFVSFNTTDAISMVVPPNIMATKSVWRKASN